ESWQPHLDAGLGTYGAQAVLEDRAGNLWAATAGAGVARYDRTTWTSLTTASTSGGLASNVVNAEAMDSTGALWFGTTSGASRFDGSLWRSFTTADGLVGNNVTALARDSSGGVWLGTTAGLSRYDGATWTSYTSATGLPANRVRSLCVDDAGRVWCGTTGGVAVRDQGVWTRYTTTDGLAGANVYTIFQDHARAMWFGTTAGLSRFDGAAWRTWHASDGLAADWVLSIAETPDSILWIGTAGSGVSRFDGGVLWQNYTTQDGLPDGTVSAALRERSGSLWFGTISGAVLYEPARVPPQTVITSAPPVLSANTLQTVHFLAAHRQVLGIEFSVALDQAPWSPWSPEDAWVGRDLTDGVHTLRVLARDRLHHVDPTPASCTFEVAATPPAPVITSPVFRQPVRDTLIVKGTAEASRFRS
ncbi:MAG TPA: two-component regulator propeller domain-containing protein, partial [Dongiaceae bacterium]|nr:two-component regulator propeller domain-containing protein [Dongiaceae bacterium]